MHALAKGNTESYNSKTGSMMPVIWPGGRVMVAHWPWALLQPGMIVAYQETDRGSGADPIEHQIVKIIKGGICSRDIERDPAKWRLKTKGWANAFADLWTVSEAEYIGVTIGTTECDFPYANAVLRYNDLPESQMGRLPPGEEARYFPEKLLLNFRA